MRRTARSSRTPRRLLPLALAAVLSCGALAACSGDGGGKPTLVWYTNPDRGGQATIAKECSTDQYTVTTQTLPQDASQQRVQLVRRLAAGDTSIDLMSLDPPFTAEFADAGFLAPLPQDFQDQLSEQSFQGAIDAATWKDQVVVAPFWSNTQVLWYRKSFVQKAGLDMSQPVTWDQVIDAAVKNGGKIGVQANKYEAYAIWVNALIAGAGGTIIEDPEAGVDATVDIDSPQGEDAAKIISKLADSSAAPSDLSVSNEGTAASTFAADNGSFMVNWTFIWTNYPDNPVTDDIGYAPYPETVAGEESHPPYGGIGIGVNAASQHVDDAVAAVKCITDPEKQGEYGATDGNMPASSAGYDSPALAKIYPADLLQLFQASLERATPRPVSPYWSDISLAIQSSWHPAASVTDSTPAKSQSEISSILQGGLL